MYEGRRIHKNYLILENAFSWIRTSDVLSERDYESRAIVHSAINAPFYYKRIYVLYNQPCRCLCLELIQITIRFLLRRIKQHFPHIFLTDERTFINEYHNIYKTIIFKQIC